jgi:uncharacterized Rossmann fold enzyme/SAM-dependent methyltransferase
MDVTTRTKAPFGGLPKYLDINQELKVTYCIPTFLRDLQIKIAIEKVKGRIQPRYEKRADPIAVVCFGPSLNDTWEQIRNFKYIITCSGAHKFLVERGIIPTFHCDVDPRPHKVKLIGQPHKDVEYLIASACHPKMWDHLTGYNVKLWHVFDSAEEGLRILPPGEWALMGGSSVGLRALSIARFLGFTDLHIFGMDGDIGKSGMHADKHPNQPPGYSLVVYDGVEYKTTPSLLECARQTFKELDQMPDVSVVFYGEGLVQAMAKKWQKKAPTGKRVDLAFAKPELISPEYRELNRRLHQDEPLFGTNAAKYAPVVLDLSKALKTTSILDYGAGKGLLASNLPFPIWEYDPAISGKQTCPRPADIVTCIDVLEHIEPDKLDFVLDDLRRCVRKVGFFVISQGSAQKTFPDGRNTHLIQQGKGWWEKKLAKFFEIGSVKQILLCRKEQAWDHVDHHELRFVVGPKPLPKPKSIRRWQVLEALVKEHGWTRGAEVGVKEGFTFLYLLERCPNLALIGVDIFEARPGLEVEGGESNVGANLPEHEVRLRKTIAAQYPGRATLVKAFSVDAAKDVADGSLDFVFIDADHREESVRADIEAWRPKVKPGGMLTGHDAQNKFSGVLKAVNDLCLGWIRFPDSVWAYQC